MCNSLAERKISVLVLRTDEVDGTPLYWCQTRVKGLARLRKGEKLTESVEAEGTTDTFDVEKLPDKFDLRSMGCLGPAEVEKPRAQAGSGSKFLVEG